MSKTEYTPGVCNIGGPEVGLRRMVGWAGLVGTLALWGCFAWAEVAPAARLWVAGPAFMSALGFLQARQGFCVNYGLGGVAGFGEKAGQTESIEDAEARAADRRTSWNIIGASATIAALVGAAAFFVRS